MSALALGPHAQCAAVAGPAAYEVRSGDRFLQSLEDGEIRSWQEYHFIMIDERTGYLMIEGGYGTFSYGWPSYGRGERSLHAFLYGLHFDYFMEKAARQPYRVADFDATLASLKRRSSMTGVMDGSIAKARVTYGAHSTTHRWMAGLPT